ncbi:hypothetical protein GCM10023330_19320 [Litoribaculum gwangyangense]|uniref:Fibronectin type-III domain-containing protein n=1 Tax=Litoribaculum gwangyangense TaxID=1130722 RepID=A0ABP9CJK6_9FLAO
MVFGCSKSSTDEGNGEENPELVGNEGTDGGVKLYFPQENMLCNIGSNVTPTESTVYFEWEANGSDNYKITIENLLTGNVIQEETSADIIPIVLQRATPYKWFIVSVKGSKTERSPTWQFYNSGPGVQSYAPFPAVIVAPNMAENLAATSSVTLQWTGSDVDDDIAGYDVYFGTSANPNIKVSDITATQTNVPVTSGNIYYWKVITKDSLGNTSDSGTYQFIVQ